MRASSRLVGLLMTLGLCGGAVAGCGGSSADDERLQNEKIESARAEGRREARAEAATKEATAQAKKLQREVDRLKKATGKSSGAGNASTKSNGSSAPAAAAPASGSPCGGGVSAGNSATTCPFSLNVADVYRGSDGASTIDVYSPVTKMTYVMSCSDGSPTVCRGGNNAIVFIR